MYEAIGLFLFFCTAISQHRLQYSKHQHPQSLEPFQAMPYAKVGALPQSTDVGRMQHHQRGKGRGKPKAMSMEDLKKQTALRLAKEQNTAQEEAEHSSSNQMKEPQGRCVAPAVTHIVQSVHPSQLLFYTNRGGDVNDSGFYVPYTSNQTEQSVVNEVNVQSVPSSYPQQKHRQLNKEQSFQPLSMHNHSSLQHQRRDQQSNNWFTDIRSETSSVRSYEYDCNASTTSNAEAVSLASAGSSHYQQRLHQFYTEPFSAPVAPIRSLQLSTARDDQVSPLPQASLNSSCETKNKNCLVENSPILITSNENGCHGMLPKLRKVIQTKNQNWKTKKRVMGNSQSHQHQVTPQHKKLPHGLTVSELKEMTRARLASEASSENPTDQHLLYLMQQKQQGCRDAPDLSRNCHSPPLTFNSLAVETNDFHQHSYQCTNSCEEFKPFSIEDTAEVLVTPKHQQVFRHIQSPCHSAGFKPLNVPSNNPNSLQKHLTPVSYMSPAKPGCNSQGSIPQPINYRLNDNKTSQYELLRQQYLDTLENASVASINSSTLGSESMHSMSYPMKQHQHPHPSYNELEPSFFSRSWSHPAGASDGSAFEPNDTPKSMSSFFEVPVGFGSIVGSGRNRVGSSPPGFQHLKVAHEDRPLHLADDATVSLFDTPRSSKWSVASRSENMLSASTTPVYQSQVKLFPDENPFPKYDACHDLILPPIVSETGRNVSTGTNMSGSICNWVAESVLRSSNQQSNIDKAVSSTENDLPVVSFPSNSTFLHGYENMNKETPSTSLASNSTLTYMYDQVLGSSSAFLGANAPITKDQEVNVLPTTSSISDSPFVKSHNNAKGKDTCNSWCDNLIGLTNHLGSLLPFVAEEKGNAKVVDEEHHSSFVSRIDPEFESSRRSPPIVQRPALDVVDCTFSGNTEKELFSNAENPFAEKPFGLPEEPDKNTEEDTVSSSNVASKSSNASRSRGRRGRGSKKNNDRGWKKRSSNNNRS